MHVFPLLFSLFLPFSLISLLMQLLRQPAARPPFFRMPSSSTFPVPAQGQLLPHAICQRMEESRQNRAG